MMDPNLKPPDEDETVVAACGEGLGDLSKGLKAKAKRAFHMLKVVDQFRSECKTEVKQCSDELDRVRAPYAERLFHYMMKCGMQVNDITLNAKDGYTISDRVCDRTCLKAPELKVLLEPIDFLALTDLCEGDQDSTRNFERTMETVKQVKALDKALK